MKTTISQAITRIVNVSVVQKWKKTPICPAIKKIANVSVVSKWKRRSVQQSHGLLIFKECQNQHASLPTNHRIASVSRVPKWRWPSPTSLFVAARKSQNEDHVTQVSRQVMQTRRVMLLDGTAKNDTASASWHRWSKNLLCRGLLIARH